MYTPIEAVQVPDSAVLWYYCLLAQIYQKFVFLRGTVLLHKQQHCTQILVHITVRRESEETFAFCIEMVPSHIWQGLWSSVVLNANWKHTLAGHYVPWHCRALFHTLCAPDSHHNAVLCHSAWSCGGVCGSHWNDAACLFLYTLRWHQ